MVRTRRVLETAAAAALWPRPAATELGRVTRGTVGVVVEGPGRTRVLERYTVAAPVGGHLLRPALRAGDPVTAGQALAHIAPAAPSPFDSRTRAEVSARAAALRAAQRAAAAVLERARHAADQA